MLMNKSLRLNLVIFVILVVCGKVPEVHYYQFAEQPIFTSQDSVIQPKILGVKKFSAVPPYDQDRIVYQESPYEIKFYSYHRWINSPAEMLTEHAIKSLRASKLFAGVHHVHSQQTMDYILSGHIIQFGEWDENQIWYANVKLWVELQSTAMRANIWQGLLESSVTINDQQPLAVVKALNQAVNQCLEQLTKTLTQNLR